MKEVSQNSEATQIGFVKQKVKQNMPYSTEKGITSYKNECPQGNSNPCYQLERLTS